MAREQTGKENKFLPMYPRKHCQPGKTINFRELGILRNYQKKINKKADYKSSQL